MAHVLLILTLSTAHAASPEGALDGVYGAFPLPGDPAVLIDGDQIIIDLTRDARRGEIDVDPEGKRLTVRDGDRDFEFTYDVHETAGLRLGVLVRSDSGWTTRLGHPVEDPCTYATGCVDWDGQGEIAAFGHRRVSEAARMLPAIAVSWTQVVGPTGRLPSSTDPTGRWWAEGVPGARVDASGRLLGWQTSPDLRQVATAGAPSRHLTDLGPVFSVATHLSTGSEVEPGRLLWFIATDGRLFVHRTQTRVARVAIYHADWADLEAVEVSSSSPESDRSLDGFYGYFPVLEQPVLLDGTTAYVGLRAPRRDPAEDSYNGFAESMREPWVGRLRVNSKRQVLTIHNAGTALAFTYRVDPDGVLAVGVPVHDGARWTALHGHVVGTPCTPAGRCYETVEAQAVGEEGECGVQPLADRSVRVGPVGVLPAATQHDLEGRWWAEGAPGTRIVGAGPMGWAHQDVSSTTDERLLVTAAGPLFGVRTVSTHSPHAMYDPNGLLLWFGDRHGRLFVHHQPAGCRAPTPRWGLLERVD